MAESWRRPRGVTSKTRKEESGWPAKVKVGYGTRSSTRGLHPKGLVDRLVWREADLEKLDPKIHIVRLAHRVGEKKRIIILEKAKQLNFHVANPGREEARPATVEEPATKGTTESQETSREPGELEAKGEEAKAEEERSGPGAETE